MKQLLILFLLITGTARAEIYKYQTEEGEWVYSDRPSPSAERMRLPPLSTYTPAPQTPDSAPAPPVEPGKVYKSMVIVEPENDATIRDNEGIVKVMVGLDPPLKTRQGHKIQFYLDGIAYGDPGVSPEISVKNVNRGTHILGAQVLNARGGLVFRADPATFHIHRQSVNNPNRVKPKPSPKAK